MTSSILTAQAVADHLRSLDRGWVNWDNTVDTFKADLAICSDDGFNWCCHGGFALDIGVPVIVVNHCTAEEYGMERLAKHLREVFPQVPVHHLRQGALYRLVAG